MQTSNLSVTKDNANSVIIFIQLIPYLHLCEAKINHFLWFSRRGRRDDGER